MLTIEQQYKIHNVFHKHNMLHVKKEDYWFKISFYPNCIKKIKDKHHAKAIRRKLKFKDIKIGDLFYTKLYWGNIHLGSNHLFEPVFFVTNSGYAIERDGVVLLYSMPVKLKNTIKRSVLVEKIQHIMVK